MPAACGILEAAVLHLSGVVRMTGAGTVFQIGVIPGAGILIMDDCSNGCAAGEAIQNAGQKLRPVFLPTGGRPVVLTWCTAIQEGL